MTGQRLKDYNKELNIFMISNFVLALFIGNYLKLFYVNIDNIVKLLSLSIILAIPTVLFTDIISREWKFNLLIDGKYSDRIFTEMEQRNDKNLQLLKDEYGELPNDNEEQWQLWYEMYREHVNFQGIWEAERNFAMVRDLVVLIICFLTFGFLLIILSADIFLRILCLMLFIELLFLLWVLNRFNKRLVESVIKEESFQIRKRRRGK